MYIFKNKNQKHTRVYFLTEDVWRQVGADLGSLVMSQQCVWDFLGLSLMWLQSRCSISRYHACIQDRKEKKKNWDDIKKTKTSKILPIIFFFLT